VDNSTPIDNGVALPDGSGFAVVSFPLPADHWSKDQGDLVPPASIARLAGSASEREWWRKRITDAGRYAFRCASFKGRTADIDPDALIMQLVVGLIGEEPRYEVTPKGRDALEGGE
jgi:hypothetical protein